jgi:hypothetical protein
VAGTAAKRDEPPPWERLSESDEYAALCRARFDHLVEVRQPLVLVSQVQRSGSTLLGQLFDGHPECHAHPYEIRIGPRRRTYEWPEIDLDAPDTWFESLYERKPGIHLEEGYRTSAASTEYFPFLFLPRLQRQIFNRCVATRNPRTEREVLDCYFTSYFNAWLDNQNLYTGPKRIVTGFTPRLAMEEANVERLFSAYPDGTLISVVRDPRGWYASASTYRSRQYDEVAGAVDLWAQSTEAALAARTRFGDRVLILTYEQLVLETEATMRRVAERIGISMSHVLLAPTFNGRPVRANSSEGSTGHGIVAVRANAHRDVLDDSTSARIEALGGELYERAVALAQA